MPTVTYEQFAIVVVPFPFTDIAITKRRPALILSDAVAFNAPMGHSVMAMITTANHSPLGFGCADFRFESCWTKSTVNHTDEIVHSGSRLGCETSWQAGSGRTGESRTGTQKTFQSSLSVNSTVSGYHVYTARGAFIG
jgi:hypothetical protein